jgi:hypothetical protein
MSRPVPRIVGYGVDSLELFSRTPLDPDHPPELLDFVRSLADRCERELGGR